MSVLNELTSKTGDKRSNDELVRRCLMTPAFVHSISEGLRTGAGPVQDDCMYILLEVAKRRPELMTHFTSDFFDTTRRKSRKLARQAMTGLGLLVVSAASEIFGEREYLLETARGGGPLGLAAATVLAALCAHSANYRGKLLVHLLRLLKVPPAKELSRWAAALGPAVEGSADALKRFHRELEPRLGELDDAGRKKLDRVIAKLEQAKRR